jgi:hypothetical protein
MTRGLLGEFARSSDVVAAARRLWEDGFESYDAFTPTPIGALDPVLPKQRNATLGIVMACGGIAGLAFALWLQWYAAAVDFPVNVGGRPLASWPAFIPSAWEICALGTVYAGFWALLAVCRLPLLYHPIFAAPGIERASQDRFFLCVDASDKQFDAGRIRVLFAECGAVRVAEVEE